MNSMPIEWPWIVAGCMAFVAVSGLAWRTEFQARGASRHWVQPGLGLAVALVALGIALRWQRLGHGPFLNMFEILASSLFSLGVIALVAAAQWPVVRRALPVITSVLAVMALWLPTTDPVDTVFPPTYETPVLWFHVLMGKVFLGFALAATGLAGLMLLPERLTSRARWPAPATLDVPAWRLMQIALLFETLMLMAGAVWAQDAWGRYWAWDPLETWAFLTWLLLVGALHARSAWHLGPRRGAWLIVAVFALAFLTFFGVPFVSEAPHKGAI